MPCEFTCAFYKSLFIAYLFQLIDWLDNSALAKQASDAFNAILNDNPKDCPVMTHKTSSNIKLFYKQRFFNSVIEPLKAKFDSQDPKHKGNYCF